MSDEGRPRYLLLKAAAQYLSISPQTLLRLVKAGKLPTPTYLSPKLPRWDRDAIDATMGKKPAVVDWYAAEIGWKAEYPPGDPEYPAGMRQMPRIGPNFCSCELNFRRQ